MGESCTEKILQGLLDTLLRYGESRAKLISSIESTIDRIDNNSLKEPVKDDFKAGTPPTSFTNGLRDRLREIDMDNERLALIDKKLNSLI